MKDLDTVLNLKISGSELLILRAALHSYYTSGDSAPELYVKISELAEKLNKLSVDTLIGTNTKQRRIEYVQNLKLNDFAKWLGDNCGKILVLKKCSYYTVKDSPNVHNDLILIREWLDEEIDRIAE